MGFALDHADASADVVGVLKESLLVPETPIHGEGHCRGCRSCVFACLACPHVSCICVYLVCVSACLCVFFVCLFRACLSGCLGIHLSGFCLALPCLALPCPALPCPVWSCLVLSGAVLPCTVLHCPVLSCLYAGANVLLCHSALSGMLPLLNRASCYCLVFPRLVVSCCRPPCRRSWQ